MQVSIPAGFNPANAVPADATVHQRAPAGAAPVLDPVPGSDKQTPGFVPNPTGVVPPVAPAGIPADQAAQFAAFLEWQKSQAQPANQVQAEPAKAEPVKPAAVEPIGADESLEMAKAAAASDPYIASTFSMFELVAPDVDLSRAIGTALDRGDASLIDIRYLREAAGDKADKLIEVAKGLVQHVNTQIERVTGDIYKAAGGEAQWDAAVAAFNQAAPQYLREFVASSLNSASPAKIMSAVESVLDIAKKSGAMPVNPQGHVRAGGGTPDASQGLSKEEFQAERMKLDRRARDFAQKEQELTARRALGKRLGK